MLRDVLAEAERDITAISQEKESILTCFNDQEGANFQALSADRQTPTETSVQFETLALAKDEERELIDRTQISIIKVALTDTTFFNRENHPARALLNEIAAASIGWTEVDALKDDILI